MTVSNNKIIKALHDIYKVWKREFRLVFRDQGVAIFFLLLPVAYPIVYSLIYNPELAREIPVAIVDDCRSELSREYVRALDASQYLKVYDYAANMQDARRMMDEKKCYGIIHFGSDFSKKIGRGEATTLELYSDMSLLIRYKGLLTAATAVSQEMGGHVQVETITDSPLAAMAASSEGTPIPYQLVPIGNTSMGLASAILPGILVLILQQSMVLAICMLAATSKERARRNGGFDPQQIQTGVLQAMVGKALCYMTVVIVPAIFLLHYVPIFFEFPQNQFDMDVIVTMIPYMLATIFFAFTLQIFVRDRESTFIVLVFSSVLFLFLSGLSWPRYAMSSFWYLVGDCIPATWAVNAYVGLKTNGATLAQQAHNYEMLWLLAGVYFVVAYCFIRFVQLPKIRNRKKVSEI